MKNKQRLVLGGLTMPQSLMVLSLTITSVSDATSAEDTSTLVDQASVEQVATISQIDGLASIGASIFDQSDYVEQTLQSSGNDAAIAQVDATLPSKDLEIAIKPVVLKNDNATTHAANQNTFMASNTEANLIDVEQEGSFNTLLITQLGSQNTAVVAQLGNASEITPNKIEINQRSSGDMVNVSQAGGGDNYILINQNADVVSTAIVTQAGSGNTIIINQ